MAESPEGMAQIEACRCGARVSRQGLAEGLDSSRKITKVPLGAPHGDPQAGIVPAQPTDCFKRFERHAGKTEFKRRQALHHDAEVAAMRDVPEFILKAHEIYGYHHFINDAGGSLCELNSSEALDTLVRHTLILYIKATDKDEKELIRRAEADPKPLYYRAEFLEEQLAVYMRERSLPYVAMIDPDDFVRWMFPRLFYARIPRYEAIARNYGYTVTTDELWAVHDEAAFLNLLERVIARQPTVVAKPAPARSDV